MLSRIAENLWTYDEPKALQGMGARMTVVRLESGDLWVHSPLAVDEATRRELRELGPVRHIVAPAAMHYLGVAPFRAHFPEARVYGSAGVLRRLGGIPVTPLRDEPDPAWAGEIAQETLRGHRILDEVAFAHRASGTLVTADLLMSTHAESPLPARLLGKLVRIHEQPGVPIELQWTFRDRDAARESVRRILDWSCDRIVLSHGKIIPVGGRDRFREAYRFLLDR